MIKYNTPQELFTAICDKIRDKTNSNELINHQDIPDKIDKLMDNDTKLFINSAIQGENTICYSLNNTTITKINSEIFAATNLTTIILPKCTSIGDFAFNKCASLTTIDLPECSSIGGYAFNMCDILTTIDLPECTSIKNNTFQHCFSLTTIDLPKCTSIGERAFNMCTSLTTIILSNNQVVTLGNINAFYSSPIPDGRYIYVPDNLVDSYKTATNWSTYTNQIKPLSELPSNLKEEYGYE